MVDVGRRPDGRPVAPPEPYEPLDPVETGAWPKGFAPKGPPVMMPGRRNVTAAGEAIASAPDLDLGPSGGKPVELPRDPPRDSGRARERHGRG